MPEVTEIKSSQKEFPDRLRQLPDCPRSLFVRGSVETLHHPTNVAVVGTRRLTRYGETAIQLLLPTWSRAGLGIVSGLALGTDAAVHRTTLETGGLTIGVLGSGVDHRSVTPRTNSNLAEKMICGGGALVSEYPPGTAARPHHFPARNRIIAGLSQATVVIEAPFKSGAMITARLALEYGLEVFAVPGPIDVETSRGTNWLIAQGAHPLLRPEDLLERLGLPTDRPDRQQSQPKLPGLSGNLLRSIGQEPSTADRLTERLGIPAPQIMVMLSELEVRGMVKRIGNKYVAD